VCRRSLRLLKLITGYTVRSLCRKPSRRGSTPLASRPPPPPPPLFARVVLRRARSESCVLTRKQPRVHDGTRLLREMSDMNRKELRVNRYSEGITRITRGGLRTFLSSTAYRVLQFAPEWRRAALAKAVESDILPE